MLKYAIIVGSVFFVMVVILFVLLGINLSKKSQLKALDDYNNDPALQMEIMDYDQYSYRNSYLNNQREAIENIGENIETYPTGNDTVLDVFHKCAVGYAEVTHDSFDADSGIITISARAANVENINKFIKNLSEQSIFSHVDYTGYIYNEERDMWDVHVTCTLAEAAGR